MPSKLQPQTVLSKTGKPLSGRAAQLKRGEIPNTGRPRGAKNKTTKAIHEVIRAALEAMGDEKYLMERASKNPAAFLALLGRIVPQQLTIDGTINHDLATRLTEAERKAKDKE